MKCDRCGLQSDVEQAFSMEKHLLSRSKHFCPDCTVRRQATSFIAPIALLTGCGLLLYALNPFSNLAIFYFETALAILFMCPLIIVHELAHAAVARLVGLRVFAIMIGVGKTLWSAKYLGMDWVINMLPIGGITAVGTRPAQNIRLKLFLIYLAGPASHLVLAFALFVLLDAFPLPLLAHRLVGALIYANIVLGVVNLFPRKVAMMTGMQGTDGWHLLRAPFLKESELTKQYIGSYCGEAMQSYAENNLDEAKIWVDKALALDGNSATARNVLGIIYMARREYQLARDIFLQLLDTEEAKQPGLHYILLNNIAYLNALLRDPALLPEADQFSAEALQHLPWVPPVIGTRGTVLVELGNLDEGIALLKKSMSLHAEKQGKALNACHIAIGELRRGDRSAARKYLATAKTLDPLCFLVPDVEAQLTAPETLFTLKTADGHAIP